MNEQTVKRNGIILTFQSQGMRANVVIWKKSVHTECPVGLNLILLNKILQLLAIFLLYIKNQKK